MKPFLYFVFHDGHLFCLKLDLLYNKEFLFFQIILEIEKNEHFELNNNLNKQ